MYWIQSISPVGGVHLKKGWKRNATPKVFFILTSGASKNRSCAWTLCMFVAGEGNTEAIKLLKFPLEIGRYWKKLVSIVFVGLRSNVGFSLKHAAWHLVCDPAGSVNSVIQNLNLRQLYFWKCYSSNLFDAMLWGLLTWCWVRSCFIIYIYIDIYIYICILFQWFCRVFQHAGCLLEHITFGNFKDWHGLCAKGLSEMCRSIT